MLIRKVVRKRAFFIVIIIVIFAGEVTCLRKTARLWTSAREMLTAACEIVSHQLKTAPKERFSVE